MIYKTLVPYRDGYLVLEKNRRIKIIECSASNPNISVRCCKCDTDDKKEFYLPCEFLFAFCIKITNNYYEKNPKHLQPLSASVAR